MSFVTTIVFILFGLYVANSVYVIYHLFHVPACHGNSGECLRAHSVVDNKLEISIFTSPHQYKTHERNYHFLWKSDNFSLFRSFGTTLNVSLPQQTRENGSLYAHVFVYPLGVSPFSSQYASHAIAPLTVYSLRQDESVNLLNSDENLKEKTTLTTSSLPTTHWKPTLNFHVLSEKVDFQRQAIPGEIFQFISLAPNNEYLPVLYIDQLGVVYRYLKPINANSTEMELKIKYSPISLGKLRIWASVHHSFTSMKKLGSSIFIFHVAHPLGCLKDSLTRIWMTLEVFSQTLISSSWLSHLG